MSAENKLKEKEAIRKHCAKAVNKIYETPVKKSKYSLEKLNTEQKKKVIAATIEIAGEFSNVLYELQKVNLNLKSKSYTKRSIFNMLSSRLEEKRNSRTLP